MAMHDNERAVTYIYFLIDPIDDQIRYVGKSQNPEVRYRQHLRSADESGAKRQRWIAALLNQGLAPTLKVWTNQLDDDYEFIQWMIASGHKLANTMGTNNLPIDFEVMEWDTFWFDEYDEMSQYEKRVKKNVSRDIDKFTTSWERVKQSDALLDQEVSLYAENYQLRTQLEYLKQEREKLLTELKKWKDEADKMSFKAKLLHELYYESRDKELAMQREYYILLAQVEYENPQD